MRPIRRALITVACLLLAACSSGPPLASMSDQLPAHHRAAVAAPETPAALLVTSAKRMAAREVIRAERRHERLVRERREARRRARARAAAAARAAPAPVQAVAMPSGGWQGIVYSMTDTTSAGCAINIFARESGGDVYATNPYSGAYGIPQALPGSKMASAGADWRTNAVTQIRWGLQYMTATYGSACGAWAFWIAHSYY